MNLKRLMGMLVLFLLILGYCRSFAQTAKSMEPATDPSVSSATVEPPVRPNTDTGEGSGSLHKDGLSREGTLAYRLLLPIVFRAPDITARNPTLLNENLN